MVTPWWLQWSTKGPYFVYGPTIVIPWRILGVVMVTPWRVDDGAAVASW